MRRSAAAAAAAAAAGENQRENRLLDQLESSSFSTTTFVEFLSWQATGRIVPTDSETQPAIDAEALLSHFEAALDDLRGFLRKKSAHIKSMETSCRDNEEAFRNAAMLLQRRNVDAIESARVLEQQVDEIARKIGSLGDAVEVINRPRQSLQTSHEILRLFDRFHESAKGQGSTEDLDQHIYSISLPDLVKYSETVLSLQQAAEQLPDDPFKIVKFSIQAHYDLVGERLGEEFLKSAHHGNISAMRDINGVLSKFRSYGKIVDDFLDENFIKHEFFDQSKINIATMKVAERAHQAITEAFPQPKEVFYKFLTAIFSERIQKYVSTQLTGKTAINFLDTLYETHRDIDKLCNELSGRFPAHADLIKTQQVRTFEKHSENYATVEMQFLTDSCSTTLQQFYLSCRHQVIKDLSKSVDKTVSTVGRWLGPGSEVLPPAGQTLLDQQTILDIIQKHRNASDRCRLILASSADKMSALSKKICDSLIRWSMQEFLIYAIDVGLLRLHLAQGISVRTLPDTTFFDVICQANEIFHLLDKELADHYLPALKVGVAGKRGGDVIALRRETVRNMEAKLNAGLSELLGLIANHAKGILAAEQKKVDFRPEGPGLDVQDKSEACQKVCVYLSRTFQQISRCLDGTNSRLALADLSIRFFRCFFDHTFNFTYNDIGGNQLLLDVTAYHELIRSVADQQTPFLDHLYTVLHSLSLMLIVEPENFQSVFGRCDGLNQIDKPTLANFLQLRADAKQPRVREAIEKLAQQ